MIAETLVRVTFATIAFVAMQNPCVQLGDQVFGPEFTKAYNAPTPEEIKALEEQAAENKKRDQAYDQIHTALLPENITRGAGMDLRQVDEAEKLQPNDANIASIRYSMLITAGKTAEAQRALERVEQITAAEVTTTAVAKKAKVHAAAAFDLERIYKVLPANHPSRNSVKTEMCKQVGLSNAQNDQLFGSFDYHKADCPAESRPHP